MRVTTMLPDLQFQIQQSNQALATATEQLSTGLRVNQLSDDPAASANMVDSMAESANVDQYSSNVSTLQSKLQAADSSLSSIVTSLTSAVSIGTSGANGTNSSTDRQMEASQVESLLTNIVSEANTNFQGAYIFAGSATASPAVASASTTYTSTLAPLSASTALTSGSVITVHDASTGQAMTFKAAPGDTIASLQSAISSAASAGVLSAGTTATINSAGQLQIATNDPHAGIVVSTDDPALGSMNVASETEVADAYVYLGNDAVNKVQVGDSLSVVANLPGSQFLTGTSGVIPALNGLIAALKSGTTDNIGNAVSAVSAALNNLDAVRVPVDNTLATLNSQETFLSQETITLTSRQDSLVGISTAEAASNLSNATLANNAVLAAAAKALPQTLLDYLK